MSIGVSSKIDYMASKVAEKIKEKFGGRGGGSQSYAQVGGLDKISAGEVAEYLAKIVKDEIT
jgi:alanyl-tRNA synthetase